MGGDKVPKKKGSQDLRATHIRGIPGEVYRQLRIEAASQEISINQLVVDILTREAKKLAKKGR
jgi:predicted HicB family RNase H-like nuclease